MGLELVGQETVRSNLDNENTCPDATLSLSLLRECPASPSLLGHDHQHFNMLRSPPNENKTKMPYLGATQLFSCSQPDLGKELYEPLGPLLSLPACSSPTRLGFCPVGL